MEVRTIGPSLGQDSKVKSEKAFAIGIVLIMIFLIIIYRMSGVVANIALLVYVLILLSILKYLDATLTLPGIAGVILSMGFAVDANILIFERFKEEVLIGKSLRTSMEAGFKRAFNTILDANVSVMIAAIVLIVMGSGTVKGFAVNLALDYRQHVYGHHRQPFAPDVVHQYGAHYQSLVLRAEPQGTGTYEE